MPVEHIAAADGLVAILPKGLCSFDAADSDFFLQLVPGPRNRAGVPDMIRVMKERIEARRSEDAFSVGCLYGPSGCGKTSIVKAGLLPTLVSIYVDAATASPDTILLERLKGRFPLLGDQPSLTAALTTVRRGEVLPEGHKLLLVIDQFEQWLQAHPNSRENDLTTALRQCNGTHLQCFVMMRDDFWVAVNRFMRELDIRLVERVNSVMIDLFDIDHATGVLSSFGRAYGRLPATSSLLSPQQKEFLESAIAGLAVDGKVVALRLALFAEIMKNWEWTPTMLKKVGGSKGVGVAFLEQPFGTHNAAARFRQHQEAARNVLQSLLPPSNRAIRSPATSHELLQASGYEKRPQDFSDLLSILDGELRLITPCVSEENQASIELQAVHAHATESATAYQLAHDFLVPSLREWLSLQQRETQQGRAQLLLAERADLWAILPENRQLPSLWQVPGILWWTRQRNWTAPQQTMMSRAVWHHGLKLAIMFLVVIALSYFGYEKYGQTRAIGYYEELLHARTNDVPGIIEQMAPFRRWVDPLLKRIAADPVTHSNRDAQLAVQMALLPEDPMQIGPIVDQLLTTSQPQNLAVIIQAVSPSWQVVGEQLWKQVEDAAPEHVALRLRAAAALATCDPDNPRWQPVSPSIVDLIIDQEPTVLLYWSNVFQPLKKPGGRCAQRLSG